MPVYRRKDTKSKRYFYKFEINKVLYKRSVPTARTRRQAEEAERQARERVHAGLYGTQKPILFSEFVKEHYTPWAETHNKRHKTDATAAKIFREHSGDMLIGQISQFTLERFKLVLLRTKTNRKNKGNYQASTVNLYLNRVSRMLALAVEWGFISKNPTEKVVRAPESAAKPRYLAVNEESLLLESAKRESSFLADLIQAALLTGFRLKDLLNLRRQDLNFDLGLVFVRDPKWKHDPRKFEGNPLSRDARHLFLSLCGAGDYVFQYNDKRVSTNMVEKSFRRAADRAGYPDLTFHKLRHTFGTRLGQRGFNQKQIARLMGHANTRYTDHYVHSSDAGLREAMEAIATESRVASTINVPQKVMAAGGNVA